MLRTEEMRELDREFTKIESWQEFLERWNSIDTEQEARGLLYVGTKVPENDHYWKPESVAELLERVNFYLRWATHTNEIVSTTCKELLVKHWLGTTRMSKEHLEIHKALLGFLTDLAREQSELLRGPAISRAPLMAPPYPKFTGKYLLKMYEVWHHEYGHEPDHKAFQALMEPFVMAACYWGLSYLFARDGNGKPAIKFIEKFLKERDYAPGKALMKISEGGSPSDLSFPGSHDELKRNAALALLKMRYWFGGGVSEKFDNPHNPH